MLQLVDQIPERCGQWFTKRLSFKDRPNEHFMIRHRNPIEVIKGLWADPSFSRDLVYKPVKLFRGDLQTEEERMFSEMWTGGFWNAAQVPASCSIALHHESSIFNIGINSTRRDNSSCNNRFRQDSPDTIFWE